MSQSKFRTILTATAALALWPALATAQSGSASPPSGSSPSQSSPSQSSQSGTSPSQGSQDESDNVDPSTPSTDQGSRSDMDRGQSGDTTSQPARQGSMTSQDKASMPKAPSSAGIDPAQVQKVFGSDVSLIDLSSLDNAQVQQLQQALQQRGHYQGPIDGLVGPKTRAAITALLAEQYSLEQRLVNQGQITEQIASSLGVQAEGRTPVSGIDMSGLPEQQKQQRPNVQSFPAPSDQEGATPPTNGQRTTPAPSQNPTPPSDSRTDDAQMDNYAPTSPPR